MMSKLKKQKVAAYSRVSATCGTDTQLNYFKEFIGKNPNWEFTELYLDKGYAKRKHPELDRLLSDCRAGKVNLIVVRSISRLSRDITEALGHAMYLKVMKKPVGILFIEENINTLTEDGSLMLRLSQAMAQNDSRSKSPAAKAANKKEEPTDA